MWTYSQSSGELSDRNGFIIGTGYSGHGEGVNNPELQAVPNVGPTPRGLYSITPPKDDPHMGPFALGLIPHAGTDCCGRNDFYMHGDEVGHVGERIASRGCIVIGRQQREEVWSSGDHVLKVVA